MKLFLKIFAEIGIGVIILISILAIGLNVMFGGIFDKHHDTGDLIENYQDKSKEIFELKEYMKKITQEEFSVYIEFKSRTF